jgi:hypothetical protein
MRPAHAIAVASLAALLGVFAGPAFGAAAANGAASQRGKAAERMSERGRANSNAQWSADPKHGWVRADERHGRREKSDAPEEHNNGQKKAKGKNKKL